MSAGDRGPEIRDRAAGFFERYLWRSDEGQVARNQLAARGLTPETLRHFRVGFAPSLKQGTLRPALRAGYSLAEIREAGLIYTTPQGRVIDRFRGRLTFPIQNSHGAVIGFGARATRAEQKRKYVNSRTSPWFAKADTLYAGPDARANIALAGRALVVEGYLDAIALHQAGHPNVVAGMGTALGAEHARKLFALADQVVAVFDGDAGGRTAALRLGTELAAHGSQLLVAELPGSHDPASMIETGRTTDLAARIAQARPVAQIAVESAVAKHLPLPAESLRRGEAQDVAIRAAREQLDRFVPALAVQGRITVDLATSLGLPVDATARYLAAAAPAARTGPPAGARPPSAPVVSPTARPSVGDFARPSGTAGSQYRHRTNLQR